MRNLFLHIGLPKTGTSTLRKHVFPRMSGIDYLREGNARELSTIPLRPSVYFEQETATFLRNIGCGPEAIARNGNDFLASDPRMTDVLMLPLATRPPYNTHVALCAKHLFENLSIISSNSRPLKVKLILTIRRQDEMLSSLYAQAYPRLRDLPFGDSFINYAQHTIGEGYYDYGGYAFDYEYLIRTAYRYFQKEDVCVLVYELMKHRPLEYAAQLANFLHGDADVIARGIMENFEKQRTLSKSAKKLNIKRTSSLLNVIRTIKMRVFPHRSFGLGRYFDLLENIPLSRTGDRMEIKDETRENILARYRDSNKALQELIGKNLGEFGYY